MELKMMKLKLKNPLKISSKKLTAKRAFQPKFLDQPAEETSNSENSSSQTNTRAKITSGVRFPWCAAIFVTVGLLSEVIDAMFMKATLEVLSPDIDSFQAVCISAIIGASCFASMAFVGFQMGNPKYSSYKGYWLSYAFWGLAGGALVTAKLISGMVSSGDMSALIAGEVSFGQVLFSEESLPSFVIAITQMILYLGTGFMTRDGVRILTDVNMREYFLARRQYQKILDDLSELRGEIIKDISALQIYPKYALRLQNSRNSVLESISQYNEAARARIEAQMAIAVDPDLMEGMYDHVTTKEGREVKTNVKIKNKSGNKSANGKKSKS